MISVIIPTLDEEARIATLVAALASHAEVIVADGGSIDETVNRATQAGATVIQAPRGRGPQMHAGVHHAEHDILWFLHADSTPPPNAIHAIRQAIEAGANSGTFRLRFENAPLMTALYAALQAIGVTYGDASLFTRRDVYEATGGFANLPLFEDTDLIRRLRRHGRFIRLDAAITTSNRRIESPVAFVRAWLVWITLQLLYWLGAPAPQLARWYRAVR